MKSGDKKTQQPFMMRYFSTPKRTATTALLTLAIAFIAYTVYSFIWTAAYNYRTASNLASTAQIRELVLRPIEAYPEAPLDPKTGDTYFPEAKVYLPASSFNKWTDPTPSRFIYTYYKEDKDTIELSISATYIRERIASRMTSAQDHDQVWEQVPKMLACARGITVKFEDAGSESTGADLRAKVSLGDNRKAFVYLDKGCPELNGTVEAFKSLKSY